MSKPHVPWQIHKLFREPKDLRTKPIAFASINSTPLTAGSNSASILPSVLKNWKTVMDIGDGRSVRISKDDCDDSAHLIYLEPKKY